MRGDDEAHEGARGGASGDLAEAGAEEGGSEAVVGEEVGRAALFGLDGVALNDGAAGAADVVDGCAQECE